MSKVLLQARRKERQRSAIANGRPGHGVVVDDPTSTFLSKGRPQRTDVGGAYRYDPALGCMVQMVSSEIREHYCVEGIALDALDTEVVYLALGRNCSPSSAILQSLDGGTTFTELSINYPSDVAAIAFGGNGVRNCSTGTYDIERVRLSP